MENLGKKIKITIENEIIEFVLLKEFNYKKDNYVLVMDNEEDACGCDDDCEDSCGCCNEKSLYIFKVDNDKYSYIEDEKELDEVIKHIDKIFYEE